MLQFTRDITEYGKPPPKKKRVWYPFQVPVSYADGLKSISRTKNRLKYDTSNVRVRGKEETLAAGGVWSQFARKVV